MTTMTVIPEKLKKDIPEAVLRKLETMNEAAQMSFAEEFGKKKKSPRVAFWLAMSVAGLHYLYLGRWVVALIYCATFAGFGVWWIIDLFRVQELVRVRNRTLAIQVLKDVQFLS